jgi:hypothetical protein
MLGGFVTLGAAKTVIHEIEGMMLLLIAALCFCTLAVLNALDKLQYSRPQPREEEGVLR